MKRILFPIAALAVLTAACGNSNNKSELGFTDPTVEAYDSLTIVDTNADGGPSTVVYHSGKSEIVRQYYSDHSLRCEGTVVDGLREGHWVFYFPGGAIQAEGTFVGGLEDGPYRVYRENGAPYYIGQYTMGVRTGIWEIYDQEGNLVTTQDFGTPNP